MILEPPYRVKALDRSTEKRYEEFVMHYLSNSFNAKQAAIDTGYSIDSASAAANTLLNNSHVQALLNIEFQRRRDKFLITEETVLQELASIAFLDIGELLNEDGTIRELSDMPERARRAMAGLDIMEERDREGRITGYNKKIKTESKIKALEALGKNLKLFTDKTEHSLGGDLATLIADARKRNAQPVREFKEVKPELPELVELVEFKEVKLEPGWMS